MTMEKWQEVGTLQNGIKHYSWSVVVPDSFPLMILEFHLATLQTPPTSPEGLKMHGFRTMGVCVTLVGNLQN